MEIVPAPGWEELFEELKRERGTALLLGATDCGKSTLARHLVRRLAEEGVRVALVDADVGQSALGLPGCVSMRVFRSPADAADFRGERFSFLGSASPARIVLRMIETTGRLAELARREAGVVLIDTTGLIAGPLGIGLKLGKIRSVRPGMVVAVQRGEECESILSRLQESGIGIHRLPPSPLARVRSQERRARLRSAKLAGYFNRPGVGEFLLPVRGVDIFRFDRAVSPGQPGLREGTVIGLNHGVDTLALGVVEEADGEAITFRAPLASLRGIDRVVFGDMTL